MTTDSTAANEIVRRSPDERFATWDAFRSEQQHRKEFCTTVSAPLSALTLSADATTGKIRGDILKSSGLYVTHYAWSQLCGQATWGPRAAQPFRLLPHAVSYLNAAFQESKDQRSFLIQETRKGNHFLRATTSDRYARVWDADLFRQLDWLGNGQSEFVPAVPTFRHAEKDPLPCLFTGDRDTFAFVYSKNPLKGIGTDGSDYRIGLVVSNSEVGASALRVDRFLFREVCGNFLIWGMTQKESQRWVHMGDPRKILDEVERFVVDHVAQCLVPGEILDRLVLAQATEFARNSAEAIEKLKARGLTGSRAKEVVLSARAPQNVAVRSRGNSDQEPIDVFSVVQGLTSDSEMAFGSHVGGDSALALTLLPARPVIR